MRVERLMSLCVALVLGLLPVACATGPGQGGQAGAPFEMETPEGWQRQTGVARSDISATYEDVDLGAKLLLAARVWRLEEPRTLEIFFHQRMKVYLLEHPELQLVEQGEIQVDGRPARFAVVGGSVQDQDVMAIHIYGLRHDQAYLIAGQVVSPRRVQPAFLRYREVFLRAAMSLRFTDGEE